MNLIIIIIACSILFGCSFANSTIQPIYQHTEKLSEAKFSFPIYLAAVEDNTNEDRQGIKKNDLGWESASIFTNPNPSILVRNALEIELSAVGFQVLSPDACVSNDIAKIYVKLEKYFVEPEVKLFLARICSVIQAEIILDLPQKKLRRRFKGLSSIYTPMFWYTSLPMEGDSIYTSALEKAMEDFTIKSIPSIVEKLQYSFTE